MRRRSRPGAALIVRERLGARQRAPVNGDVVEVITRKIALPRMAWLDLVRTTHAREKIRSQLRKLQIIDTISGAAAIIRDKTRRKRGGS